VDWNAMQEKINSKPLGAGLFLCSGRCGIRALRPNCGRQLACKPVTIVVSLLGGGSTDIVARIAALAFHPEVIRRTESRGG
jgi:hypothetical protein